MLLFGFGCFVSVLGVLLRVLSQKKICPDIYQRLCSQAKQIIYITGTNGKTTTTLLLATLLVKKKTAFNPTGANLEHGLISALIKESPWGKLRKESIVLEVDEKVLPSVLEKQAPNILICLNLFRDQLDRHAETDLICQAWQRALQKLPEKTTFLFNGDDPALVSLGRKLTQQITYFGLNEPERGSSTLSHAVDSIYCPSCKTRLEYHTIYFSHLGDFSCNSCTFKKHPPLLSSCEWPSISSALYNKYNTMAAVTAAVMSGADQEKVRRKITRFWAWGKNHYQRA